MHSKSTNVVAALLLLAEAATAGHIHLELGNSIAARSGLERRGYVSSDISHTSDSDIPWYYVYVYLGNPPQQLRLKLEDRGTTWLPWLSRIDNLDDCSRAYPARNYGDMCDFARMSGIYNPALSGSFANITTGPELRVSYPESETTGVFGTEDIMLNQLTVSNLTVGLGTTFNSPPTLGIGLPQNTTEYPYSSFLETLQSQGLINSLVYSIYLNGLNSHGDVHFGSIDQTKFYGDLQKFDNGGKYESQIPISGVWWYFNNGTATSLVKPNGENDDQYKASSSVTFGDKIMGLPQSVYDLVKAKFPIQEERDGQLRLPCDANIDTGSLCFAISKRIFNISSTELVSGENRDGGQCYRYLTIDVVPPTESSPFYRLGDPFLRGAYAVFDHTNKQTLIAPAFINATGSNIIEVGLNGGQIEGTGHPLLAYHKKIYRVLNLDLDAPGTPSPGGSSSSNSRAIIVGGILGGIFALLLILGAVYAIRPRSQRSRNFATWFAFGKNRKETPEPVIAYPAGHGNKFYQRGSSRITPQNYGPPQPDTDGGDEISRGAARMGEAPRDKNSGSSSSSSPYYPHPGFGSTRPLSDRVEMAATPASMPPSPVMHYPPHHNEITRYGSAQ
ncbi:hypothetical protein DRE_05171 [Drechslerella stenobrocha 248]|uniref:Peptidase A1 domain-containing protein n=1 Tax=Drechslerella stenobrocha 248 TaxID=1043628 RepID=W7I9A1_9PEZI|nr:hypothetical protein DRE_05171 [Drechslerella stenobrocha 248]